MAISICPECLGVKGCTIMMCNGRHKLNDGLFHKHCDCGMFKINRSKDDF